MACALPLLLGRVAPSSHRLLRTCVCLLSFFLTYVCYCALFSSNAAMQHAAGLAPNCRRVLVDGGKRRLQKSPSCVSTFGGRENQRALMIPSHIATTRNSTRSLATGVKFGNKKLPSAIIVGVKKGGTRAVLEFIRIHPDVRAVGTETHFFDRNYDKGLDWYRSLMPRTLGGQITMEKTPSYFVTREVPRRISGMSRGTKLIVVVRDPVTRAISDYTQTLSKSPDLPSFQELAFLLNRSLGATATAAGTPVPMVDTSWNAIQIGLYALHLENWLRFFPREQMHFVSGEQLIADPAGELARLQDFLGLRRVVTDKHFFFNRTKGFPCLKKPESGGSGGRGSPPRCLGKSKGRPHVQIDRDALEQLRDFYRPHNVRFYEMVGHDFRWE